ncbi:MAG: hypothetical protein HS105_03840 [Chloracidobacterium sp.]|nr:hypothetical protein [Chloracidobacterium sp.]
MHKILDRTIVIIVVMYLAATFACKSGNNATKDTPIPSPSKSKEEIQEETLKKSRDRFVAAMEHEYSTSDQKAKITVSNNGETLTIDSEIVSCKSVGTLYPNPENRKPYAVLGFKELVVIDPKHRDGKCSFDMTKTTY